MAIATEKNIAYLAELVDAKTPALQFIANKIDSAYTTKSSATVDVELPGYGVVTEGEAVGDMTVETAVVPVTVGIINTAAELGIVQEALEVGDYTKVVANPRAANMAKFINSKVIKTAMYNAEHAIVSTGTFTQLSNASAELQDSRIDGKMAGFLAPKFKSVVTATGTNYFNANPSLKLYEGVIGEYDGIDWMSSVDMPVISTGVVALSSGTTVGTTVSAEGATTLVLAGLSAATGTVKAGTVFNIAGANGVSVMGDSVGYKRAFVVTADATVTGSGASVTVKPIYFTGPKKNVSSASNEIASGAVVTSPMAANTTYVCGVAWNENAMAYANKPLAPMHGVDSGTLKAGSIQLRMSSESNVSSGKSIVRWDTLFGVEAIAGKGICNVYVAI